jgi:lipid-A-disaccharide synthase
MHKRIFIICGELSGESHAARVLYELLKLEPNLKVHAMGSNLLSEMGAKIVVDYKTYSFSGFTEVVRNLPRILKLKETLLKAISEFKPDLVLGVDYSGLNLEIASALRHRLGDKRPKFVQYIAPQLWASRAYRINKVKRNVDKVLCTLPFEQDLYTRHGVPVTYVGNPVASSLSPAITKQEFLQAFLKSTGLSEDQYIDDNQLLLGIFPGSRGSEIRQLMPVFVEAARALRERIPNSKFVLAKAPTISMQALFEAGLNDNTDHQGSTLIEILEPKMMFNASHKLLAAADLLWLCSGTVTLEAALYSKPYFLTYKGDALSFLLYKLFRTIDMAGLANIIARKHIVREFLQDQATSENFLKETLAWLDPAYISGEAKLGFSDYHREQSRELSELKAKLSGFNTQELVAKEILCLV